MFAYDDEMLRALDEHPFVRQLGKENLKKIQNAISVKLLSNSYGEQIDLFTESASAPIVDDELLSRAAAAYELAALQGMHATLYEGGGKNKDKRQQLVAGAWRAYQIRRLEDIPTESTECVFHVLHVAALAYCGDQWHDMQRWLEEKNIVHHKSLGDGWDLHLLCEIYNCWLDIFAKRSWESIDSIAKRIDGLRELQAQREEKAFQQDDDASVRTMGYRLLALYHWAKATEIMAEFILQGKPADIDVQLDKYFEEAQKFADQSGDMALNVLLRWLHVGARQMANGSIWQVARQVNSKVSAFVKRLSEPKHSKPLLELLPPQRAALLEKGLLNPAIRALVIDLPTSGGKTLMAQFRILQTLGQFGDDGWIGYIAPTRALVNQMTRRFRRDFEPMGINVEQLTAAQEIDDVEAALLEGEGAQFNILLATPEKMQLVIRNKRVKRPLRLAVIDEAHNIADDGRGLRLELLLATIRSECADAGFLLMTPDMPNADEIANWLGRGAGGSMQMSTTPWRPNERIIGLYTPEKGERRGDWYLKYEISTTTPRAIHLGGEHRVGREKRPLAKTRYSTAKNSLSLSTAAMAKEFCNRGTSIVVGGKIPTVWNMARALNDELSEGSFDRGEEIVLAQQFLRDEIGKDFELIEMLGRGIGVHHSGLSDDTRELMELLAESGKLKVLCATTTIVQGIDYSVSSVFLQSNQYPYGNEMPPRDFWNLAGRVGRQNQKQIGVIGLAANEGNKLDLLEYINKATGALASRLINLTSSLIGYEDGKWLAMANENPEWRDFSVYVAHLFNEHEDLSKMLANLDTDLRNTYGYHSMRAESQESSRKLLKISEIYIRRLARQPGILKLADTTGFNPESVGVMLMKMGELNKNLKHSDWLPDSLFKIDPKRKTLADLYGVLLRLPEFGHLREISDKGLNHSHIAKITADWVGGMTIEELAKRYFADKGGLTEKITQVCRIIYRRIATDGAWGVSSLMQTAGLQDSGDLSDEEKRQISMLPSMIYHGVSTEEAVLMRMNSVPRRIAENLGAIFGDNKGDKTAAAAREFLRDLPPNDWHDARPQGAAMDGKEYKKVWRLLSGYNE